jgi:hypothetical protein
MSRHPGWLLGIGDLADPNGYVDSANFHATKVVSVNIGFQRLSHAVWPTYDRGEE